MINIKDYLLGYDIDCFEQQTYELKQELLFRAIHAGPHECCGYIKKIRNRLKLMPLPNLSLTKHRQFNTEIMLEDMGNVISLYHSHPVGGANPSHGDITGSIIWPNVIVSIAMEQVRVWDIKGDKPYELPLSSLFRFKPARFKRIDNFLNELNQKNKVS